MRTSNHASENQGVRLPSENEMSTRFGVSRPAPRQSLLLLKNEGLIESGKSSGKYACGKPRDVVSFGLPESLADLEDCLRFRMVIESAAAGLAARRADANAIEIIRQTVAAIEQGPTADTSIFDMDFVFHLAVARATKSKYFGMTLAMLKSHILFGWQLGRQLRQVALDATSKRMAAEHHAILSAIELVAYGRKPNVEDHQTACRHSHCRGTCHGNGNSIGCR
jgi:GntR family transcriptional regulator, transcriptional repressor for pyruvate dehydrogenase complex